MQEVSWEHYESLLTIIGERPNFRLTYLEGSLEIMTLSPEHEQIKAMIARLLIAYSEEVGVDLFSCGSTTFRNQAVARGLEADESYCVGGRQPLPDLAIEVVITSGGLDKLRVYEGLGIPEVWIWQTGQLTLYHLHSSGSYTIQRRSQFFPDLDLNQLTQYIQPDPEPQAVRAFRQTIRVDQQGSSFNPGGEGC